jgi:hypothetical protein
MGHIPDFAFDTLDSPVLVLESAPVVLQMDYSTQALQHFHYDMDPRNLL